MLRRNLGGILDLGVFLRRNSLEFSIWACFSEEIRWNSRFRRVSRKKLGRNSRFRRVSRKKRTGILDLGVFLGRNSAEFLIWACFSEEIRQNSRFRRVSRKKLGRNSRFRRVSRKKQAGFLDLGVLLKRNTVEFPIWACFSEETRRFSGLRARFRQKESPPERSLTIFRRGFTDKIKQLYHLRNGGLTIVAFRSRLRTRMAISVPILE